VRSFHFSQLAENDLLSIGDHTLRAWGPEQTKKYLSELEACCQMLANNPELGRACDDVRPGLRRLEQGKHVIFFRLQLNGILISRILHERMLPKKYPIDDEDI